MKTNLLIGFTLTAAGFQTVSSQPKPNVLFIMTDQQSYNMMSCMGNKWLKTPNMDRIAEMGYRFERVYSANPVCMPSRFSLLTGHYASEVGVKENTQNYNEEKVKQIASRDGLGNIFRRAGYETLYSGKTHLYGTKNLSEYGFDLNNTDPYDGPAVYAEKVFEGYSRTKPARPFFMFLSFLNPHDICYKAGMDQRYPDKLPENNVRETSRLLAVQKSMVPEEYRREIPSLAVNREPINGEQRDMVSMDVGSRAWNKSQWDLYNWMYHRLTESVDAQVGRVLAALEKSGMMENTIIVFTSDHGDMNGAHQLTLKNVAFEECQRIPLIFSGKGIKKNYVDNKTLVCNGFDFLPTICDLAGIEPPGGLSGISLKPYLTGVGNKTDRKCIITETYNSSQINDGRYKYTLYELPGHPELLTDLQANPGETVNYADDPSYAGIKANLKKELMSNLKKRNLVPVAENRTIENIRAWEKSAREKRGEKVKVEIE